MEYVKTGAGLLMGGVNMVSNFVKTAMPKDQSKIRLRPEVVQIMMDVAYYFFIHTSLPDTKIHVHKLYFDYDLPGPQQAPLRLAASKSREELKNLPALTEIALSILPPSPINYEKMPKLEDLQELNEYKKLFKQLLTLDKVTLIWYTVMRGIIALQHHYKEVNITPPLSLSSPPHEKELHVDSFENKNNLLNSHVNNCFQSTLACIKKALVGKYEFKEVRTCASLVIKGYMMTMSLTLSICSV